MRRALAGLGPAAARRPNGRADRPGHAERELDPARRARREPRPRRHREGLADADRARPLAGHFDAAQRRCRRATSTTHEREQQGEQRQPAGPVGRRQQADDQGHRPDRGRGEDGAAGRVDQRGAPISSISRAITLSTGRPSISAAAERMTRWRSTAGASALTSSGMT